MQDLKKQEQFEIEVLDRLNSRKILNNIVFCGGTMLRLCFGLNRFSVDLDFWIIKETDTDKLFKDLKDYFKTLYILKDYSNKFNTLVFELKSNNYPRSLKIEIRKEIKKIKTEQAIAYSKYSNQQVLLKIISLREMMKSKVDAFLSRKEIRDIFDIEFLFKKGIPLDFSPATLKNILQEINSLTKQDYTVKLGSILEQEQRKYYVTENFKIVKLAIQEKIKE